MDVGGEPCETNRAGSSVLEVIMYDQKNMIVGNTQLKPKGHTESDVGKVNDEGINNEYHPMETEKRMTQGKIRTGVVDITTNVGLFPHRHEPCQDPSRRLITQRL